VISVLTSYIYIRVYNGVLNKRSLRLRRYLENHNGLGLGRLQARITQMLNRLSNHWSYTRFAKKQGVLTSQNAGGSERPQ
jgi:hypothetical protein